MPNAMGHYPNQGVNVAVLASKHHENAARTNVPTNPYRGGFDLNLIFYDYDPDNTDGY